MRFNGDDRFGRLLLAFRLARSMSQARLAELIGVSQVAISQFERGESRPAPGTRKRLARALAVDEHILFGGEVDG